ncbi:hypothetical protein RH915_04475 [Serpentinicella sp. ANB-PHB4]|uniref:hypothetical protein n=1 Tax=Serpentinicella sp. ANB-PHB4 TaxID=3074076 RepID=UPI0028541C98|nr:hypothetical protein [Serpentinicella sp. ANB-PHB4]MDR5658738.1 hypothetical protein [Serpentinicella sp. ANB-PHB4]
MVSWKVEREKGNLDSSLRSLADDQREVLLVAYTEGNDTIVRKWKGKVKTEILHWRS